MAVVAQWQSTALWMQMLRVRAPSAALFKTDRQHADWFFYFPELIYTPG